MTEHDYTVIAGNEVMLRINCSLFETWCEEHGKVIVSCGEIEPFLNNTMVSRTYKYTHGRPTHKCSGNLEGYVVTGVDQATLTYYSDIPYCCTKERERREAHKAKYQTTRPVQAVPKDEIASTTHDDRERLFMYDD